CGGVKTARRARVGLNSRGDPAAGKGFEQAEKAGQPPQQRLPAGYLNKPAVLPGQFLKPGFQPA
ncbi:MAG TPA: hypothetical protein DEB40_00345, partial [Elusimicrobia bacterium]|nr:hypothetical protein [Elusimicrobiota bacterium]